MRELTLEINLNITSAVQYKPMFLINYHLWSCNSPKCFFLFWLAAEIPGNLVVLDLPKEPNQAVSSSFLISDHGSESSRPNLQERLGEDSLLCSSGGNLQEIKEN